MVNEQLMDSIYAHEMRGISGLIRSVYKEKPKWQLLLEAYKRGKFCGDNCVEEVVSRMRELRAYEKKLIYHCLDEAVGTIDQRVDPDSLKNAQLFFETIDIQHGFENTPLNQDRLNAHIKRVDLYRALLRTGDQADTYKEALAKKGSSFATGVEVVRQGRIDELLYFLQRDR